MLPYVDLLQFQRPGSLANLVARARGLLVSAARMPLWEAGVAASTGQGVKDSCVVSLRACSCLCNRAQSVGGGGGDESRKAQSCLWASPWHWVLLTLLRLVLKATNLHSAAKWYP